MLDIAKTAVAELHDNTEAPMRWGHIRLNGKKDPSWGGCFYGVQSAIMEARAMESPYFYTAFHGDGAKLSFSALTCVKKFNEEMKSHKQDFNKFIGTARTEKWVSFLLSDASPWRLLRPYFAVKDASFVNQAGFIWKDIKLVPSKLWYNFVMAYRLPWEFPKAFGLWQLLVKKKVHPALALYISLNFELDEKATDLSGPYNLVYPWSALEETCYESVGRFTLGEPAETSTHSIFSPNVHPLWRIKEPKATAKAEAVFEKFNEVKVLMLEEIVTELEALIADQKRVIDANKGGTQ